MCNLDGNQTRITTKTGTWQVTYNGENRPVLWSNGATNVVMSYDRMGRRVACDSDVDGAFTLESKRFSYNGYLLIHEERLATDLQPDAVACDYVWDPTEPVATLPLVFRTQSQSQLSPTVLYYTHDGNKNVSELVDQNATVAAHYEYAPFGAVTISTGSCAFANPFRFSSEYADDGLMLNYYNYRHYNPLDGRWFSRDMIGEELGVELYSFVGNSPLGLYDIGGLAGFRWGDSPVGNTTDETIFSIVSIDLIAPGGQLSEPYKSILRDDVEALIRQSLGISQSEYLSHCPCCIKDALMLDGWSLPEKTGHRGGDMEVRRKFDGPFSNGQQCVYDVKGRLINVGPAAGTPDRYHPEPNSFNLPHKLVDGWPYVLGRLIDFALHLGGVEADTATAIDHWWNEPDIGMDKHGNPCPLNDGSEK